MPSRPDGANGDTAGAVATVTVRPKHPPGQRSRKARRYGDQIRRLQAVGYTLEDIREALAEAGVVVSKSTVQREASRRPPPPSQPGEPPRRPPSTARTDDGISDELLPAATGANLPTHQSGKDVAAAFFAANNFNPLFRKDER